MLEKDVAKGKLSSEESKKVRARITATSQILDLDSVDFAIEAVSESLELKQQIFGQLSRCLPAHAILASNTSSISISKLASVTARPEQVIGMHFMNPGANTLCLPPWSRSNELLKFRS